LKDGDLVSEYSLTIIKGKGNNEKIFAQQIEVGLKIEVKKDILEILKNHEYIKDHFTLNIKRLNRWIYSVYFDKKCNHI
jgi:hypothetical protein